MPYPSTHNDMPSRNSRSAVVRFVQFVEVSWTLDIMNPKVVVTAFDIDLIDFLDEEEEQLLYSDLVSTIETQ